MLHSGAWSPRPQRCGIDPHVLAHRWRADINSLEFHPSGHAGVCLVHQRAFGTLLGFAPSPVDCAEYFEQNRSAFERASADKIMRESLSCGSNFHLTSRDVRRASIALSNQFG